MFCHLMIVFLHQQAEDWFQACCFDEFLAAWAAIGASEGVVEQAQRAGAAHFAVTEHD